MNSHSPVGLVSRQWDAVDWACVLCDCHTGEWMFMVAHQSLLWLAAKLHQGHMTGSWDIHNGQILSGQTSYMLEVQIPVVHMLTTSPHYAPQLHEQITLLTNFIIHKSGLSPRAWRYKLYNHYFHSLFVGVGTVGGCLKSFLPASLPHTNYNY